jgi:magnesium transporter
VATQEIYFSKEDFHWLDVVDPTSSELEEIARKYELHATSVQDCLDPEHLPKFERIGALTFIIVRAYDEACSVEADTVQELTRKIAIFSGPDFLVTIHRKDQLFFAAIRRKWCERSKAESSRPGLLVFSDLLEGVIASFERPIEEAMSKLDEVERSIFKGTHSSAIIEDGYYLKRRAFVIKRILRLTMDVISKIYNGSEPISPLLQDLKESADSVYFYADELVENVNSLLNLHISLSSQRTNEASHRTNEVVRVLTLFSVFFMPLTFIAGIYGMNFQVMPELKWQLGYPFSLALMFMTSLGIFLWFKGKGWLK